MRDYRRGLDYDSSFDHFSRFLATVSNSGDSSVYLTTLSLSRLYSVGESQFYNVTRMRDYRRGLD
jgi:hypothetical protein